MTIGNPSTFAVAFEVDTPETRRVFGKFSYVVGGRIIGNYSQGCSLSDAASAANNLLTYAGQRNASTELMTLSATDLFDRVNSALYVDSGQSDEQVAADKKFYWRFQVKDIGFDAFDGWKCYLFENGEHARFIWRHANAPTDTHDVLLPAGEFDRVLADFVRYVEDRYGALMRQ